jgi:hypothetical protein
MLNRNLFANALFRHPYTIDTFQKKLKTFWKIRWDDFLKPHQYVVSEWWYITIKVWEMYNGKFEIVCFVTKSVRKFFKDELFYVCICTNCTWLTTCNFKNHTITKNRFRTLHNFCNVHNHILRPKYNTQWINWSSWSWSYGSLYFITIYAITAYHHWCCEFEYRSGRGVQHYVIKFVSDLRQVGGFLRVIRFPPPIKLTATI